jgi:two-component system, NtrC family, sensor kinase
MNENKVVILCVDDEKIILESLREQLIDHFENQYEIETAEGGIEAIELFKELLEEGYEIPLIISDCLMPDMKGDELLMQIHSLSRKTLKIMLTGQKSTEAVVNVVNHANLYRYIGKPWEKEDLLLTVSEAIKSYFKDQQIEEQNQVLKKMNTTLTERSEALSQALEHLKATQQELVQTEKMAALGQLVAGIAHEINTPLGSIRSAVRSITQLLSQILEELPAVFQLLTQEHHATFFDLLQKSIRQNAILSSQERRKIRRGLARQLEQQAIMQADTLADTLVDIGIYEEKETFLPLLKMPNHLMVFQLAYQLASLSSSIQTLTTASDRVTKIVFALKHFAHYDHIGEKIKANLIEGIETVLTLYNNQLKQGVKVIKNYGDLPLILCYPDDLNQVWTNLVHNALQAMKNKGTLQIDVLTENEKAIVHITDSGEGIPSDIQTKIFEPFFTTKPPGEGSGLGLDIVAKIIDKHNGSIKVDSIPGKTTFTVSLPINNGL